MSASTEKKQRQAAREAGTDKKTLAEQEAAKKKAKSNRRWTLGTIGVILLIALILFLNSSFLYTHSTAISVGDSSYSPAEVSYVYANEAQQQALVHADRLGRGQVLSHEDAGLSTLQSSIVHALQDVQHGLGNVDDIGAAGL